MIDLLRWPAIAPTLGRIHTTDKAPCSLSCCRIQPRSAPRIRLGVQLLVMNSTELWFRELALAHRERVSQERFFFGEEGLVKDGSVFSKSPAPFSSEARFCPTSGTNLFLPGLADP